MSTISPPVTLRAAGLQDLPAIVAVQARSWRESYRGLVDDDYLDALPLQKWMESWRAHLFGGRGGSFCVVAECAGRVVGFASAGAADDDGLDRGVGELHTIYIGSEHYGTGLGKRLLESAVEWMAGQGYTEAVLWVLAGNERATRFYRASGWHPDGATASDAWGATTVPRVRLRLRLRPG